MRTFVKNNGKPLVINTCRIGDKWETAIYHSYTNKGNVIYAISEQSAIENHINMIRKIKFGVCA